VDTVNDLGAPRLITSRLSLRPLTALDLDVIHAVWTSAGVRRFLFDDDILSLSRTREMLERNVRLFDEDRLGLWGGWSSSDARLIAFGGFWYFRDPPELELVYGVVEDEWGRGYATEVGGALVAHAFGPLRMSRIRASTDAGNRASVRVLEKLGFQFVREAFVGKAETRFYELSGRNA
jgi:ribosomal-protein-alanine N-acetyltransferase